jgi:peptide/nickel transport system ATP-binding protein
VEPVLKVENLTVEFPHRTGWLRAVRGVDLELMAGETLALVGESGSGKSVTSSALMGLIDPPARVGATRLLFEGKERLRQSEAEWRKLRGQRLAMIFQDPMTALNPVMRIGQQVIEPLQFHEGKDHETARLEALAWLSKVGLSQPDRVFDSYPHQLSGGMRQRVVIAMALCCRPTLIIADEPTTALDVTVQAQILRLLRDLQQEVGMAVLLITHDLGVVQEVADRVAVMYAGQVVETGSAHDLFRDPQHPYTRGLLDSIPRLDRPIGTLPSIPGGPPGLHETLPGCAFAPRCAHCFDKCAVQPALLPLPESRSSRCWLVEDKVVQPVTR